MVLCDRNKCEVVTSGICSRSSLPLIRGAAIPMICGAPSLPELQAGGLFAEFHRCEEEMNLHCIALSGFDVDFICRLQGKKQSNKTWNIRPKPLQFRWWRTLVPSPSCDPSCNPAPTDTWPGENGRPHEAMAMKLQSRQA